MSKIVLYTATRNLYQDMVISMKSLLHHTKLDKVYCFIEDDTFPYQLPEFVKTINVTKQKWLVQNGANWNNVYSWIVLMRAIAFKFIDEDKILSIDCDTIVMKDISEMFDADISNYYYAAVQEDHSNFRTIHPYFNFGVVLMNLEKIKEKSELIIDLLNEAPFGCPEQDVMLIACKDHILPMKNIYNAGFCTFDYDINEVKIRHYIGRDEKREMYKSIEYRKYLYMPWEEVMKKQQERLEHTE